MRVGLGSHAGETEVERKEGRGTGFKPPTPGEISAHFPQLEILELLGRGGMGAVYKARQKQLDRLVALKILPPSVKRDPSFAERFTREAKALAKLNHPHIVTLYEFGQTEGIFYFLMEFVDGVNLRQLQGASRVTPEQALAIVPQICDALQYAHQRGIVHRDIKPENILLSREGEVKIADFGVAKIIAQSLAPAEEPPSDPAAARQTRMTGVVGTPQYMAPEQVKQPAKVDHRADIYSLGVVFYEMLTGELPGEKFAPPSRKVRVDVRIDEIVLRALEKKPELRYQQASVLKTDVETVVQSSEAPRPPPPPANPVVNSQHAGIRRTWTTGDRLLQAVAFVGAAGLSGAMVIMPATLPPRVPVHFDLAGRPDRWGTVGELIWVPLIGLFLYGLLTAIAWAIPAANAERQYVLVRRMVLALTVVVVWSCLGGLWQTGRVAVGAATGISPFFLLAVAGGLAASVLYVLVASRNGERPPYDNPGIRQTLRPIHASRTLYQDQLIAITDHEIVFHRYYFPFGGDRHVPFSDIESIQVRPPSLLGGSWRLWGSGDFRTWFPQDFARPSRDRIFILLLRGRFNRIGFTVEDSPRVIEIMKERGFSPEASFSML